MPKDQKQKPSADAVFNALMEGRRELTDWHTSETLKEIKESVFLLGSRIDWLEGTEN
jgi:hypothetical protein